MKNNKKEKIIIIITIILIISIIGLLIFGYIKHNEKIEEERIAKEIALVKEINSHYNNVVITNIETNLYNKNSEVIGKINKDIILELDKVKVNKNTKMFPLKELNGYYIKYNDVNVTDKELIHDDRYKNYIVFNENIITKDVTSFYDDKDNYLYTLNESFNMPIIIKDNDRYGIEYNNRLLFIKKEDVKEIKENHNTDKNNSSAVGVLNYHAFYDENNKEETRKCNSSICHSKKQFREHLDYIKENKIFTLKTNEIEMYLDGKIRLPKSVLITIDDGIMTEHAVNLLTEYKMYATIFLITNWFNENIYHKTEFIELHSHSHDLHRGGFCPGGQGSPFKCLPKEKLLEDLKQSRNELGGSTVFCYPFFEYNKYAMDVVKEAGFTMAFAGGVGDGLVRVGDNKFKLNRYVVDKWTTKNSLRNYFNQIKN